MILVMVLNNEHLLQHVGGTWLPPWGLIGPFWSNVSYLSTTWVQGGNQCGIFGTFGTKTRANRLFAHVVSRLAVNCPCREMDV